MLKAIEKKDRMRIAKIYKELLEFRIKELEKGGETSIGNLIYKTLRSSQYSNGVNLFEQAKKIMLGYH